MLLIILLVILLILLVRPRKENYVEMFGFSGHKKPVDHVDIQYTDSQFDVNSGKDVTESEGIDNDDINVVTNVLVSFVKEKVGLCVYPIETNSIRKFKTESGKLFFKCRFMYTTTSTSFPISFGLDAIVMEGKVVNAKTQSILNNETSELKAYTGGLDENYIAFDTIEKFSNPSNNAYGK